MRSSGTWENGLAGKRGNYDAVIKNLKLKRIQQNQIPRGVGNNRRQ